MMNAILKKHIQYKYISDRLDKGYTISETAAGLVLHNLAAKEEADDLVIDIFKEKIKIIMNSKEIITNID